MPHRPIAAAPRGHASPGGWRGVSRRLRLRLIDFLSVGLYEADAQEYALGGECLDAFDFEHRLRRLFAGRARALSGRLHFVNLAELHAFYGERWPSVSASIHRIVATVIRKIVGPKDFFVRISDAYMIVFPDLSPDEAEGECARISDRIRTALTAAFPEAPPFEVGHVTQTVDGGFMLSRVPADEPPADPITAADPASAGEDPSPPRQTPGTQHERAADMPAAPQFNYRPIWNTRTRQVSSYACLPAGPLQAGSGRQRAEFDRHCLDRIINDSRLLLLAEGRSTNIFFPVHFSTLMDPTLRSLFDSTARAIPAALKHRLIAEVIDIPAVFERAEVLRLKATLSNVAHAMVARVPLGFTRFHHIKIAGFASVGLDISTYTGPEAKVQSLLDGHVVEANRLAIRTYIHGLRSISMITFAVCAGFDHIDGQPISSFENLPNEIFPLDPKSFYAHLLTEAGGGAGRDPDSH